jgi:hypothetical protein
MPQVAEGGKVTWTFWDSITLGAADVEATLFQTPRGQGGKTKYDTNMVAAGQLPKGNAFTVEAFSWGVLCDVTFALTTALSKGYWEITVSDKIMSEGLLFNTPMGAAVDLVTDAAAAPLTSVRIGTPDARNLWTLGRSYTIEATEQFDVHCVWPVAPTAVKFWFMIHGELLRPLN